MDPTVAVVVWDGEGVMATTTYATTPNAAAALDQFSRKLRRRCVLTHTMRMDHTRKEHAKEDGTKDETKIRKRIVQMNTNDRCHP